MVVMLKRPTAPGFAMPVKNASTQTEKQDDTPFGNAEPSVNGFGLLGALAAALPDPEQAFEAPQFGYSLSDYPLYPGDDLTSGDSQSPGSKA
jgi:hypothetical protein